MKTSKKFEKLIKKLFEQSEEFYNEDDKNSTEIYKEILALEKK